MISVYRIFFLISENIFTKHIYLPLCKCLKKLNFSQEFYFKFSYLLKNLVHYLVKDLKNCSNQWSQFHQLLILITSISSGIFVNEKSSSTNPRLKRYPIGREKNDASYVFASLIQARANKVTVIVNDSTNWSAADYLFLLAVDLFIFTYNQNIKPDNDAP